MKKMDFPSILMAYLSTSLHNFTEKKRRRSISEKIEISTCKRF